MMDIHDCKDRAPKITHEWAEKGKEQYDIIMNISTNLLTTRGKWTVHP